MKKSDLVERILREFGWPTIKVELDEKTIHDQIDFARNKYIKWAAGQATHETYFTIALSAGENFYDMPTGVVDVLSYDDTGMGSGINTLFTIDNFLYNQGMYDAMITTGGEGYTMISYHIAKDFLSTVKKYTPTTYNWKYHRYSNTLEIHPAPPSGNSLLVSNDDGTASVTIDSPGFVLLRSYMIEGSTESSSWTDGDSDENFYGEDWILEYSTARCKKILGLIRRKFGSFASIGNQGIALDGDTLVSEADTEIEKLEETLRMEENWIGYGISIGY